MAKEVITELEVLFTANTQQVDKAAKGVRDQAQKIERNPVNQKVDGDATGALAAMDRVEAEAKKIVSAKTMATVDANIGKAETSLSKVQERLDYLRSVESTMEVTADIKKAESALGQIERRRDGLVSARESMVIDADTAPAKAALGDIADEAGDAGAKAGDDAGQGLAGGIIAAIATIPVAGAVVGIGATIGKALLDGLQVEVRSDRLMATTGLDPATVGKLARASGEAYAGNWGASLEANMDTARLAIQGGLLDPKSAARDSQAIIASLSGVSDIIGEDIAGVSRSTAQLLRTGLAKDAAGAFDIIVKGTQAGLNASEDLLDTLDEYSTQFRVLGLDGPAALGLLSQAVKAGARDTDTAAGALMEFAIRAVDGSKLTAESYAAIGLSAEDMAARVIAGGPTAAAALEETLVKLREMEPGAERTAAAVGLFGTKAEDLGAALYSMDLSTAVAQLGDVEGAAKTALDTLGDNAAGSISSAQRNIEVAADGIKGALATAFNPQIEGFATFVSENREAVMQFLLDLANGGFDAARGFVEFTATSTEAIGDFISGPLADLAASVADVLDGMSFAGLGLFGAQGAATDLRGFADGMRKVSIATDQTADDIRTNLIENGIDPAQEKFNEFAIPKIAQAAVHDASLRLASSLDGIGYAADGTTQLVDALTVAADGTAVASTELDTQIRAAAAALDEETAKALAAGEGQEELTARYEAGRLALIAQLEQMGLTSEQAQALAEKYGAIPGKVDTLLAADQTEASATVASTNVMYDILGGRVVLTTVDADTAPATSAVDELIRNNDGRSFWVNAVIRSSALSAVYETWARGARPEATGDILTTGMQRLSPIAQKVAPGTLKVMGDSRYVESFIPHDGSARSMALLDETARLMGRQILPLAVGSIVSPSSSPATFRQSPAARTPSLVGLAIEGTLDMGGGLIGVMRGVVKSELADAGSRAPYAGGS